MFGSKKSRKKQDRGNEARKKDNLGMFGMYEDEDNDEGDPEGDPDLEAQLNELIGTGKKKATTPKPKEVMDLSAVLSWTNQISSSIQDDDDDEDVELDESEEGEFMAELEGIVGDDNSLQAPAPNQRRSPSPQPGAGGTQMKLIQDRKKNYETALQIAKTAGEGSKVRRYQRGVTTLDDLLRKTKSGKPINEEDIPPQVATGKPPSSDSTSEPPPLISLTTPEKPTVDAPIQKPALPTSPTPVTPPKFALGSPRDTKEIPSKNVDMKVVETLKHRQHEFKKSAFAAKKAGNMQEALNCMKMIKQFNVLIESANSGEEVDLSRMPSLPGESPGQTQQTTEAPKPTAIVPPRPREEQSSGEVTQPAQVAGPQAAPVPKTLLEGLIQRKMKYQSTADQASGSKARRMGRIVKQYDDAISSHKAGRPFNVAELPVPMGYPPLPGEKPADREDIMTQAGNLLKIEDEGNDSPEPRVAQAAIASAAAIQSSRPPPSPNTLKTPKSPSRSPSPKRADATHPSSAYQQQIEFLVNRQAIFKQAALDAKNAGDKETAMNMLRKMKGFEPMIEQAKNGLRIDISKVPQPPILGSSKKKEDDDAGYELLGGAGKSHEDDEEIYKTLLDSLDKQIKKARGYSEQFTHSGDVNGANMFDKLSRDSQQDHDFVKNLHRHSDPPPRYYFDNKTFESVHIIPEINSTEIELIIVQLLDVDAKDIKPFVEWEMPFPHDSPIKGHTEQQSNLKYNEHFRIPIIRKNKSFQRAIKTKAVKFQVIQKGSFLRSDKSLGSASVKLSPLESTCEIRVVEPLREGRASVGRIEVKIRMRTPLVGSESRTITEKWLVVSHEHVARRVTPRPSHGRSPGSSAGKKPSPKKESKIGSLEVLALEKRIVDAKIKDLQGKGERPPTSVLQNQQMVQTKLNTTQRFLREGGLNAKQAYVQFLKSEIGSFTKEAQSNVKQGRHDQAKFSLTKRKMIESEIQKMAPSNTYL